MSRDFSPLDFLELGTELKRRKVSTDNVNHRRFKTWFGIDWNLMSVVWHLLWSIGWMARLKQQANPKHLLWTLLFLKEYKKEGAMQQILKQKRKQLGSGCGSMLKELQH